MLVLAYSAGGFQRDLLMEDEVAGFNRRSLADGEDRFGSGFDLLRVFDHRAL